MKTLERECVSPWEKTRRELAISGGFRATTELLHHQIFDLVAAMTPTNYELRITNYELRIICSS
ncbi:MAG: hypothetical protein RM021_020215 [Nostoc sp. EkiNYC01]|nr:hypothetical protein [Nostoc sp. EkiNYC01]